MSKAPTKAKNIRPGAGATWALPYQARFMADTADIRVARMSRQVGKSEMIALEVVASRLAGARTLNCVYTAQTEDRAREFVGNCAAWARKMNQAVEVLTNTEIIDDKAIKVWSVTLTSIDGRETTVWGLSSSPGAIRGRGQTDWIWDEAAFHDADRKMWAAGSAVATWGGRITVLSSAPDRMGTLFDEMTAAGRRRNNPAVYGEPRPGDMDVSLHEVTIDHAIADGLVERINAVMGSAYTREAFRARCRRFAGSNVNFEREYLCKTVDEAGAWLTMALIRQGVYTDPDHDLLAQPTEQLADFLARAQHLRDELGCDHVVAGYDVGRKKDLSILWLLGYSGNPAGAVKHTLGVLVLRNTPYTQQAHAIDSSVKHFRVLRLCIDDTGLGNQLAEQAAERHGSNRIEGVTFTAPVKEDLAGTIRVAFEERRIQIPDHPETLAGLNKVRVSYTTAGNPRYKADSDESGHADEFWAAALALHAAGSRSAARFVETEGGVCP